MSANGNIIMKAKELIKTLSLFDADWDVYVNDSFDPSSDSRNIESINVSFNETWPSAIDKWVTIELEEPDY